MLRTLRNEKTVMDIVEFYRRFPNAGEKHGLVKFQFDGHFFLDALQTIEDDPTEVPPIDRNEVRDALEVVLLKHEDRIRAIGVVSCGVLSYLNGIITEPTRYNLTTQDGLVEYSKQIEQLGN